MPNELPHAQLAVIAFRRAQRLARLTELATRASMLQAVALLYQSGISLEEIAAKTGLAKSEVNRMLLSPAPQSVASAEGVDLLVYEAIGKQVWDGRDAEVRNMLLLGSQAEPGREPRLRLGAPSGRPWAQAETP